MGGFNLSNITGGGGSTPSVSPWAVAGKAADAIGGFLPQKSEYSGDKGALTSGLDAGYDKAADALMSVPGWGTVVGGAMKLGGLANKGLSAIGGGTDGETTGDALLGSNFGFALTGGLSVLNGFLGSNTDSITKNNMTLATVGSSYSGTYNDIDDAVKHSNKKYGLISLNAMKNENLAIHASGRLQNTLTDIANQQLTNTLIGVNQESIASLAYASNMQGGYNQGAMRAAKQGMKLFSKELRERTALILAKKQRGGTVEFTPFVFDVGNITKFKKGGKSESKEDKLRELTNTYEKFVKYLKEHGDRANDSDYNLKAFYESTDTFEDEDGSKLTPYELWLKSEAVEPGYGHMIDEFKQPWHITYGGEDGSNWKEEEDGWTYYVPEGHKDKNGKEYTWDDYALYFSDPEGQRSHFVYKGKRYDGARLLPNITVTPEINYYKEGGQMNVIPEGALHARKHEIFESNPELKGQITEKGIPVVVEGKESGEVELQAEIEVNEIVFNKEVTTKLEELAKKYHDLESSQKEKDSFAIEAGKLLALEIMENTDDRTGLIQEVK